MISSRQKLPIIYIGGDIIAFILALTIFIYFFRDAAISKGEGAIMSGFIIVWFIISYWRKLSYLYLKDRFLLRLLGYVKIWVFLIGLIVAFCSLLSITISEREVVLAIAIGFPLVSLTVDLLNQNTKFLLQEPNVKPKYILIAGIGRLADTVSRQLLSNGHSRYQLRGFINCSRKEAAAVKPDRIVGDLSNLHAFLKENPVEEIVIALSANAAKKVKRVVAAADYYGIRTKFVPDYQQLFGIDYHSSRFGQIDAVNVRQLPLDERYSFALKTAFDKVFATAALLFLAPFFLVIALLIKLESPGPVFYCPIRIGKGGKPFKLYKFRSMRENDASTGGMLSTQKDDARITRLGHILRKYSLDELPQFFNVLIGNMSVVGPRPHRSYLNQLLQESVDKYMIRHYFRPGITGWAQVNGWRGPTETVEQRYQRTLHDLWYYEHWSLALDLKIIYLTIFSRKVHKAAF